MPEYIVCSKDVGLPTSKYAVRVDAPSPDAAIALFNARIMSKDNGFREHVLSQSINAGILESFFFQSEFEEDLFNTTGTVLASDDVAILRIRKFFGDRTDFAEAFIAYFKDSDPRHVTEEMFEFLSHHYDHGFVAIELDSMPVLSESGRASGC